MNNKQVFTWSFFLAVFGTSAFYVFLDQSLSGDLGLLVVTLAMTFFIFVGILSGLQKVFPERVSVTEFEQIKHRLTKLEKIVEFSCKEK